MVTITNPKSSDKKSEEKSWRTAFTQASELQQFGSSAIGLFALALRFDIDDIVSAGAASIVDGSDDKKNDIIFIDEELQTAIIAQAYISNARKSIAPANKASDLNTAITWLLSVPAEDLPKTIKAQANRLREGIREGVIKKVIVWYVHNCTESANVQNELEAVKVNLSSILATHYSAVKVQHFVTEVGNSTLTEWYNESESPILVNDLITFDCPAGFSIESDSWDSFVTHVPALDIYQLYKKYNIKLFSANIRDYLGARSTQANINNGIQQSISKAPKNFWVFNNGITALTHQCDFSKRGKKLKVTGLSIVNGAQTTGAIGTLKKAPDAAALVPIRFVSVREKSRDLIHEIVRYNNSQNQVAAADFRSTDPIQKRLRAEVSKIKEAEYEGGRRGGFVGTIKRRPKLMPSLTIGQALAAFHGEPMIAYNKKSEIWNNDSLYSQFFNEKTTGAHLVFVYALLKSIEQKKIHLLEKSQTEAGLTRQEQQRLDYLRLPAGIFIYIHAIAQALETIIGRRIVDFFSLSFGSTLTPRNAIRAWDAIVDATIPFTPQLTAATSSGFAKANIDTGVQNLIQQVEVAADSSTIAFQRFSRAIRKPLTASRRSSGNESGS